MDGNRFDDLTRSLATGTSRRTVVKRSVAAIAALAGLGAAAGTDAARSRPTPTPVPIRCPGNQVPCGAACCCPTGTKCGADCCADGAQCCDGACCHGQCYGEEQCCPTGQIVCDGVCLERDQCCTDADCHPANQWMKCGIVAPHVCTCLNTTTCASAGFDCGLLLLGDCDITLYCGECTAPDTCGGGGSVNVCGRP